MFGFYLVLELVPVLFEEGWNKFDPLIVVDIRDHSEIGVERLSFFVVKRIEKVYPTFVHLARKKNQINIGKFANINWARVNQN